MRIKPGVELVASHQMMDDVEENGSNLFRLDVDSSSDTYVAVQPAVEIGSQFQVRDDWHVRPNLVLSVSQFLGDTVPSVEATFASDPGGNASFETRTDFDDTHYRATVGLDIRSDAGMIIQIEGFLGTSDNSDSHGASLRVLVPF